METQIENVVTKGAKPAEPMQKLSTGGTPATWEDLGGPTPENYKTDDDSAKLKTPGGSLKQVKDVVNKGAKAGDSAPKGVKEEEEKPAEEVVAEEPTKEGEEVVAEEPVKEGEEVVAEEETSEEEVVAEDAVEEKIDVEEDINALIAGEELSEEFQEKARTIFEAAIKSKVSEIKEQVESQYKDQLTEEVETVKKNLTERVDSYLEYVAQEWLDENKIAIEHGLKTEMTESFLNGMKGLFEEHYVSIPEEKYDVIESMVDKLDEMEGKLNEQIEKNVALNRKLAESTADGIFAEVTEGLADTQRDKLAGLAENVEFESEADYREKLVTLRDSYFPENAGAQRDKSENLSEETSQPTMQEVSGVMERYLQTLNRVSKK
jgi:nucleoid DNA-binding protein